MLCFRCDFKQWLCFVLDVSLSSDFIVGFCGETEENHRDTLSLIEEVQYRYVYQFAYSMRQVHVFIFNNLTSIFPSAMKLSSLNMCMLWYVTRFLYGNTSRWQYIDYRTLKFHIHPSFPLQKTHAYHRLKDTVPQSVKRRRVDEVIECSRRGMLGLNQSQIGQEQLILIEGVNTKHFILQPIKGSQQDLL